MSGQDGDNKTILGKTLNFPQKVALVKPGGGAVGVTVSSVGSSDGKTTTVSAVGQPQGATYRTINQSHMRLVMPATQAVPTPQFIQTHLMPQAMLKPGTVDPLRTQITALPARSLAQTSITVTRSPTPTSFVPRATNVSGARATVVTNPRTPTPPITPANITNFVRNTGSTSRTPSPAAATVISAVPGTTWMSAVPTGVQVGVQGTHLIRASINPSGRPQGRVLTQPNSGANVVTVASSTGQNTSIQVSQAGGVVQTSSQVSQMAGPQTGTGPGGQILATVQCPRPQTATLVYSNVGNHGPGQPFGTAATGGGQRLTLSHSRPIRPIQLTATNNRITGTGLRTANISIRPPSNVPGLTSTNVLTGQGQGMNQQQGGGGGGHGIGQANQQQQQQQGRTVTTGPGIVNATGTANLATRIIQVQAPQSGGTAQVINTGRISGNLMTLTPVLSQVGGAGGNVTGGVVGRGGGGGVGPNVGGGPGKVQPSLTITHVGKITQQGTVQQQQQQQQQQQGQLMSVSAGGQGGHIVVSQAPQQPQTMIVTMGGNHGGGLVCGPMTTTATTIGQQAQQQQHHQVMNVVSQPNVVSSNATMLSGITTTVGRPGIVRTLTTSQAGGLQGSMGASGGAGTTTTLLPLGKVGGGNSGGGGGGGPTGQTIVETQLQQAQQAGSIFIHSRSPNPVQVTGGPGSTTVVGGGNTGGGGNSGILTLAAATASQSLNNIISGVPYSVQQGNNSSGGNTGGGGGSAMGPNASSSFAVVTNRGTSLQGVIPVATSIMAAVNNNSVVSSAGGQQQTHQIITMTQSQQQQQQNVQQQQQGASTTQHIMIPVAAGNAVTAAKVVGTIGQSPRPSILRKRDNEGGMVLAANSSTIVSTANMSGLSGIVVSSSSSSSAAVAASSAGSLPIVKGVKNLVPILHAVGTSGAVGGSAGLNVISAATSAKMEIIAKERSSGMYVSPPAGSPSDGSTTVSANSSPGVDKQQLQQHQEQRQENELNSTALSLKLQSELKKVRGKEKEAAAAAGRSREPSPRKKIKKSNNDSSADLVDGGGVKSGQQPANKENSHTPTNASSASGSVASNNNNEGDLIKPRTASLMETYRHTWKAAHNHFLRYSDVKPREERRPTVIDLANQAHVTQKVNGWKIYHLSAQMEDLCEMESQMYDKLAEMLQCMEAHDQSTDVDRVNELLKGNMQRIKIINDGVTESKKQIMKVFDHKSHITDIIHRCGRRNFKKREKL